MNGEAMPKAVKEYFYDDQEAAASQCCTTEKHDEEQEEETHESNAIIKMDHFVKDFGTSPNLIIYHNHVDTKVVNQISKDGDQPN